MKLNLGKIVQDLDYYIGLKLLKSPKFFSYTTFDKILEKKFSKNQSIFIKNFLNQGFSKIDCNFSENVDEINSLLILNPDYNIFNKHNNFQITNEIYLKIKKIVNEKLKLHLEELELLFNGNVYLTEMDIQRNTENSKALDTKFHVDYYLSNYFKIFINLSDVSIDCGPTEIVPKKFTKKYMDFFGYKSINKPMTKNIDVDTTEYIYSNMGKKNEATIFHSSTTLHRAGVPKPGMYRDLLRLTFVIDFQKKITKKDVFHYYKSGIGQLMSRSLAKPKSFSETFNIYKNYKKTLQN